MDNPEKPAWRIRLFGPLTVESAPGHAKFRTRKTAQLVALLSIRKDSRLNRSTLADMFWPDGTASSSKQSLRMALTDIRGVLGEDAILADQDWLSLNPSIVDSDLSIFERATKSECASEDRFETLSAALELVTDEPLAGCEMEWAAAERFRICDELTDTALELLVLASTDEERQTAIQIGKRILRVVGLREDLHIALIKLHIANGLPSQAIAQYEELENALIEQWGERPSATATQALESIPRATGGKSNSHSSMPRNKRTLVGRDELLETLRTILENDETPPITTLIGPGGSGKTSLAISLGRALASQSPFPIWFVELARTKDESEMLREIAAEIGLEPGVSDQSPAAIAHELSQANGLLILDNFEQLPAQCALRVGRLGLQAPRLRILITSRTALRVDGEHLFTVPPLQKPERVLTLEQARSNPAIRLFELEARSANPKFMVTASNVRAVIELCRRLDGLPLALELAAARMVTQSPAQALSDLQYSTLVLKTSIARTEDRHKSLWEAMNWSYQLLSREAQETYLRISMYGGPFDRAAVAAQVENLDFDSCIEELVRASILNVDSDGNEPRFWMLETMRDFARERLSNQDFADDTKRRYVLYWIQWADSQRASPGMSTTKWLNLLLDASSEITSAIEIGVAFDDLLDESVRLLIHFAALVHLPSVMRQRAPLAQKVLVACRGKLPNHMVASVCNIIGIALMNEPDASEGLAAIEEGIALSADSPYDLAKMRYGKGHLLSRHRRYEEAFEEYEWALQHVDPSDETLRGRMQLSFGKILRAGGKGERTLPLLLEALQIARKSDTPIFLSHCLDTIAYEFAALGRFSEAHEMIDEALALVDKLHSINNRTLFLSTKGRIHQLEGIHFEAYNHLERAARYELELDTGLDPKRFADVFSAALRGLGHLDLAAKFLSKGEVQGSAHRDSLTVFERRQILAEMSALKTLLGEFKLGRLLSEGRAASWESLLNEGRAACDDSVTPTSIS